MRTVNKYPSILLALIIFFFTSSQLFGWGGATHKRITYFAWKYAGLPASSGEVTVPVVWNLDSVKNVKDLALLLA